MQPPSRSSTPGEAFRNIVPTQDKRGMSFFSPPGLFFFLASSWLFSKSIPIFILLIVLFSPLAKPHRCACLARRQELTHHIVPLPLPPALSLALSIRDRQIPSVLTPKPQATVIPTISYADAITFLTSQLQSIQDASQITSTQKKKNASKSKSPAKTTDEEYFLTERMIDVALYDPKGVYMIPLRTFKIKSTTTLSSLILILQGLLDGNVHDLALLSNSHTHPASLHRPSYAQDFTLQTAPKYLVSSFNIKVFLSSSFAALPALKGSISRHGAQYGGALGEDGVGEGILEADRMHWALEGKMEKYWEIYKSIILLNAASTPSLLEPMSRPVINVHSVKKPGGTDRGLAGGGHIFIDAPKVRPNVQLDEEGRELVNNILASFGPNVDAKTVSNEQITQAVTNAYAVQQAVKKGREGKGKAKESDWKRNDTIQSSHLYGQYDATLKKAIWAQSGFTGGGYPKNVNIHPVRNWGVYQGAHGDPAVHAAFPLDHVPFEEKDFPPPGQFDCNTDSDVYMDENGTWMRLTTQQPVRMVPFMKVPAALFLEANRKEEERKMREREGGEAPVGGMFD